MSETTEKLPPPPIAGLSFAASPCFPTKEAHMGLLNSAKRVIGKAMRPIHAGDEKLLTHQEEICALSDRAPRRIEIHSDAFDDNGQIPIKYSAEGLNVSPPLAWPGVPAEARELRLVSEEPDAPMRQPSVHR